MTGNKSNRIFKKLHDHYGDISPDLKYRNLYQLTIAVVLSAQTTDVQVNSVTPELFKKYPGFKELSEAAVRDVENIIRRTGFYHNKAKNIIALSQVITRDYKGKLPRSREGLMQLPGIGRKSANVILSVGMGIHALAVDTHIKRIAKRLGYIESDDPYEVEKALTMFIPENMWTYAHLVLIKHGRSLCKARAPLCGSCPINRLCSFADKTP